MSGLSSSAAREYVEREHADVVAAIEACADAVAETWSDDTGDAAAASGRLDACLRERSVLDALPGVLAGAVDAAGGALQASPVAASPYVVVASRGPLLRATLDDGRLVVQFEVFRVTESGDYERAPGTPTVRASVE